MAKYRYVAIVLGLAAGLTISWWLGLGGFLSVPHSMADSAAAPEQDATDEAAVESSALALTTIPAPTPVQKGVITSHKYEGGGYLLYIPTSAGLGRPLTLLVSIRGMGDRPEDFATGFAPRAEANGWILIVPRFNYGDWKQIETLRADDRANLAWLNSLLDVLPGQIPFPIRNKILIYGFSRGAQSAHRFALMHPERVLATASMSAGTYTLPVATTTPSGKAPLDFPLGVADLDRYCGGPFDPADVRHVAFWIGVGEKDNSPGDVPQSWDQYIGSTRVERARTFAKAMANLGAPVQLEIIPRLGHGESARSRARALAFLKQREAQAEAAAQQGSADPAAPGPR